VEPIVDALELTPLQEGMLVHQLDAGSSGVDFEQIVVTLPERVDETALRTAWDRVYARHQILRTTFHWERLAAPRQQVHDRVTLPWESLDWRGLSDDERAVRRTAYLTVDRQRPFDWSRPPLGRFALAQEADDRWTLFWSFPHVVLDGRSDVLLLEEAFAAYEALREGRVWDPPRPRRSFHDYVVWLRGLDPVPAEAYWRQALAGFRTPTPFRIEPDADASDEAVGSCEVRLAPDRTAAARAFARDHGITLNTLVQGAWALVLSSYSGEHDVVFGCTRACRRSALGGADDVVGLLLNTLPFRVRIDPDATLVSWLQQIRQQQVDIRPFEHTALQKVQVWSDAPRGRPLFDTLLAFENQTFEASLRALGGTWATRGVGYYGQTNFAATLNAYGDTAMRLRLQYRRHRIGDAAARVVLERVATLLEGIPAAGPDTRVGAIRVRSEAETVRLAAPPAAHFPVTECLHQRFEAVARRYPDRVAVACDGDTATYRDLDRRANRLARRLQRAGVGPDTLVGLAAERSIDLVVAVLATLKAGGAYVPLDPAYPAGRLAFMIEDAGIAVLLTQAALAGSLPPHRATVVLIDQAGDASDPADDDASPPCAATPDHLAYVIYTSGSTGEPKGALISHANVMRLMEAARTWFDVGPDDVWTLFHSYAFDFSVWEMWGALLHGGRLVVVPYWVSRAPDAFLALLVREQVTVLSQTPSAFRQLADVVLAAAPAAALALRYVVFGGEALELQSLRGWIDRRGDARPELINMYGITETTVHVTYRRITAADLAAGAGSVIGVPLPDLAVYLLDGRGELVPSGVPGEVYVGGAGVARGYLNRPALTAERFVPSPFEGGGRLYRSGDLARRLISGELEYLGRIDQQVKIRGFRIELGEIEAVLGRHPAVQAVVVIAREDTPGDRRLAAYVVPAAGREAPVAELRALARERLPDYMVPAAFVSLAALPLTANGKIDRRALPAPEVAPVEAAAYVAPRTPAETALARIWSDVLRVERVGADDNFFELGGDSILSIQVIARAREAGLHVTPKQMFDHPTVAGLARVVRTVTHTARPGEGAATGALPLTPIQRWFFDAGDAGVDHYNQAMLLETRERVEPARLARALDAVLAHHDALRSRFRRDGGAWTAAIAAAEPTSAAVPVVDLSTGTPDARRQAIHERAAALHAGVRIATGPIVRALLFDGGPDRPGRLLIAIHHLAVDGVSWRILLDDLQAAYAQASTAGRIVLPAKTTSYREWAERLVEFGRSEALAEEAGWWLEAGRAAAAPAVPVDFPGGVNSASGAARVTVELDAEETRALLRDVPRACNTQINDALLSALARAWAAWRGPGPLVVDLEGHGREAVADGIDLSRTVGWFTSIFPVRLDVGDATNPVAALRIVKEQLRAAPGRGVGYGVLRYLSPDPSLREALAAQPAPPVSFNYLGQFDQIDAGGSLLRLADDSFELSVDAGRPRRHLIDINALVTGGRLRVEFEYGTGLHRRETVLRLARAFGDALRAVIAQAASGETIGRTPSDFPLAGLEQAALDRLIQANPDVEDIYPLSPMQQLYYAIEAADARLGLEQWTATIRGPLDAGALKRAWAATLDAHTILRTSFVSDGLPEPLQIVHRRVDAAWHEADWRGLAADEQRERLAAHLGADRDRGFDLAAGPLARFSLIRQDDQTWRFVWTTHHLLIDGWSWPLVFAAVSAAYDADVRTGAAAHGSGSRFRDYVAWIAREPEAGAEAFWRAHFKGLSAPPLVARGRPHVAASAGAVTEAGGVLGRELADALRAKARQERVSLNTLVQGAWAVVLAELTGARDVVLGVTLSGRPPELSGVDAIVGPCVTNLPLRVAVAPGESLAAWLRGIHEGQHAIGRYPAASLARVQQWSGLPWQSRLFDNLLVFQNYRVDESVRRLGPDVRLEDLVGPERTNYPLTAVVVPTPEIEVRVAGDGRHLGSDVVQSVLEDFRAALGALAAPGALVVADVLAAVHRAGRARGGDGDARAAADRPAAATYVAPRTEAEKTIVRIWQEAFETDRVGVEDNFFDLGGHSLLMIQVHARIRDAFQAPVPIVALFQYPTAGALARHLADGPGAGPSYADLRERAGRRRDALARRARQAKEA
jgi:amino acid adenylation domain-containing protein/non-ribosomal peptide synthase protein (TIGR01720 family)